MPGVVPVAVELTVPLPRERAEHTAACGCVGERGGGRYKTSDIKIQSTQIQYSKYAVGEQKIGKTQEQDSYNSLILTQVGGGPLHVTFSIQVTLWSPDSW